MKAEKQQTAVEWLVENYLDLSDEYNTLSLEEMVKQAKEMEKEQTIKAHNIGRNDKHNDFDREGEQYYNETFKSE